MSDLDLEKLIGKMREYAPKLAEAKGNRVYLDQFRKSKKAILFQQAPEGTVADRENYAYSHKDYLEILDGLREAVTAEEELKYRMRAAELLVEVWRTQQANSRAERKGYGA